MAVSPDTQPSLLVRIRAGKDTEAWAHFVKAYAPAVYGFLQKQGLQGADAADLTQDVMVSVASAIKSFDYQPKNGRFRGWLFTVVQNKLRNFWRAGAKRPVAKGDTQSMRLLGEQPDERGDITAAWDREYEQYLFAAAADSVRLQVQERTWNAFWSTLVEGRSPTEVGSDLNMTPAAVRLAKARVLARMKRQIQILEGESQ